ncbi:ATP-dependent Clp protease ATP-binding subunit ClpX [Lachnospiraceae bacterium RM5]|nr:ATP-dependent Clp protease ATP-binding subunit ClpX [Lachnospiraceae bacterium RM5]
MSDNENRCCMCQRTEEEAGELIDMDILGVKVCKDCMENIQTPELDAIMDSPFADMLKNITQEDVEEFMKNSPFSSLFTSGDEEDDEYEEDEENEEDDDNQGDVANKTDHKGNKEVNEDNNDGQDDGNDDAEIEITITKDDNEKKVKKKIKPEFHFVNLADMMMNQGPKVKKRKPGEERKPLEVKEILPPHKIKERLDEYVVGQEYAKKVISVGVYNHYKRVASTLPEGVEIEKSNMLMIGPTGSGKTYMVKTLAKILDVPLAITDATSLTEAGYVGDDIESVLSKLLAAADNDVDRAESGIIFIDEIDKIAKKRETRSRDVSGESVQQGLLKLLEGSLVEVPVGSNSKSPMVPMTTIDTKNILFICGGAFPDLEGIIKERLNKQASIGFIADLKDKYDSDENLISKVTTEDLRDYGMIPEFLGRMPVVFTLEGLTNELLVEVLKEPRNAIIKQYEELLKLDEVKLVFEDDALLAIADKALDKKTGARALRSTLEEYMLDIMYEIPKDKNIGKVTITKDYIEHKGAPLIEMRGMYE